MDIGLDGVGARRHGPSERPHRVLGVAGLVPPVRDRLWDAVPVEGPFRQGGHRRGLAVVYHLGDFSHG